MRVKISLQAYQDLEDIYHYTHDTYGVGQAEKYRLAFDEQFQLLSHQPEIGVQVESRPHLRRIPVGQHIVFYRVKSDAVYISRIHHGAKHPKFFQT